jgi:hypothetical protein
MINVGFLRFVRPGRCTMGLACRVWGDTLFDEGMVMRNASLLVFCAFLFTSAAQAASVNYISQERVVTARAGGTDSVEAPDFGPFSGVATASAENEDTRVRAEARLTSQLTQTVMSFLGRLELEGEDLDPSDDVLENLDQSANTHSTIRFELTLPHTFRSSQSFTSEGPSDRQGVALLSGPGGFSTTLEGDQTGVLAPGEYRLDFTHDASSEADIPITASVDFSQRIELTVIPLPAGLWPGLGLFAAVVARAAHRKRRHG